MAAAHRSASAHLNNGSGKDTLQALLNKASSFSFFQAIRLLRHLSAAGTDAFDAERRRHNLYQAQSLPGLSAVGQSKRSRRWRGMEAIVLQPTF